LNRQFVSLSKQKRRFQETIPLISFNDSIDFVQQFQWICSTIPLNLSRHSAAFIAPKRRFCRSFSAVLALLGRLFIAHLLVVRGKRTPLSLPFYWRIQQKAAADGINRIVVSGIGINKTGRGAKPSPKSKFMMFFFVFSKKIRNFAPDLQTVS
jgi:hypothetical protein